MNLSAEDFKGLNLEEFVSLVKEIVEDELESIEESDSSNEGTDKSNYSSTTINVEKSEEHPPTKDDNGNYILIGACRKTVIIITDPEGEETHYGSSVEAGKWRGISAASVRSRCRKEEFVDDEGNTWEEMPIEKYRESYEGI